MKMIIVIGSIIVPIAMCGLKSKWPKLGLIMNLLAILSALIFGNISAFAVYDIIRDKTVFMTNVHAVFLNPLFLITGSYLGLYLLYVLVLFSWKGKQ